MIFGTPGGKYFGTPGRIKMVPMGSGFVRVDLDDAVYKAVVNPAPAPAKEFFKILAIAQDYLECVQWVKDAVGNYVWSDTLPTPLYVAVAKPRLLRASLTGNVSETVDGITRNYTYFGDGWMHRNVAASNGHNWTEKLRDHYLIWNPALADWQQMGACINASMQPGTLVLENGTVTLTQAFVDENNDARYWHRIYVPPS